MCVFREKTDNLQKILARTTMKLDQTLALLTQLSVADSRRTLETVHDFSCTANTRAWLDSCARWSVMILRSGGSSSISSCSKSISLKTTHYKRFDSHKV